MTEYLLQGITHTWYVELLFVSQPLNALNPAPPSVPASANVLGEAAPVHLACCCPTSSAVCTLRLVVGGALSLHLFAIKFILLAWPLRSCELCAGFLPYPAASESLCHRLHALPCLACHVTCTLSERSLQPGMTCAGSALALVRVASRLWTPPRGCLTMDRTAHTSRTSRSWQVGISLEARGYSLLPMPLPRPGGSSERPCPCPLA